MEGGAICMELLTPTGWASAYTVEAIIVQLASTLVKGNVRYFYCPIHIIAKIFLHTSTCYLIFQWFTAMTTKLLVLFGYLILICCLNMPNFILLNIRQTYIQCNLEMPNYVSVNSIIGSLLYVNSLCFCLHLTVYMIAQGRISRKPLKDFNRKVAEASFQSLVRTHEKYGWVSPPLADG